MKFWRYSQWDESKGVSKGRPKLWTALLESYGGGSPAGYPLLEISLTLPKHGVGQQKSFEGITEKWEERTGAVRTKAQAPYTDWIPRSMLKQVKWTLSKRCIWLLVCSQLAQCFRVETFATSIHLTFWPHGLAAFRASGSLFPNLYNIYTINSLCVSNLLVCFCYLKGWTNPYNISSGIEGS